MKKYICIAPDREEFNIYGKSLGMRGERALYYLKSLHRHRIYRNSYPVPNDKDFKLFEYKNKNRAQALCDEINQVYNDNFSVVEIESEK